MIDPGQEPTEPGWAPPSEIAAAIKLAANERGLKLKDLGDTTPGMTKSKLYRRLEDASDFTLLEMARIGHQLQVPAGVLLGGQLETLRYLRQNNNDRTPDGGPAGELCAPWDLNPEPAD